MCIQRPVVLSCTCYDSLNEHGRIVIFAEKKESQALVNSFENNRI